MELTKKDQRHIRNLAAADVWKVTNTATFEIVWNEVIEGFSLKGKISNLVSTTPLGLMIDTNNTEKK